MSDSDRRDPKIIWNWPSGMTDELVLRLAEDRPALRADADDAEVHALDLDDLVDRIDGRAEQPVGGLPAEHGDRPRRSTSVGLISRPRSASKVEKFTYSDVTPCTRVLSIDLSR